MTYPVPENEARRVETLHELQILDTPRDAQFDEFVKNVAARFNVPMAIISLVDTDRQWFKATCGLCTRETPRKEAFCAFAVMSDDIFVVEDTAKDPRFVDNPLVTGAPHIRFYAGAPIVYGEDIRLGALCIADVMPRKITPEEFLELARFADWVSGEIWARQYRSLKDG